MWPNVQPTCLPHFQIDSEKDTIFSSALKSQFQSVYQDLHCCISQSFAPYILACDKLVWFNSSKTAQTMNFKRFSTIWIQSEKVILIQVWDNAGLVPARRFSSYLMCVHIKKMLSHILVNLLVMWIPIITLRLPTSWHME